MGYYLRFILTDEKETTPSQIEKGLQKIDPKYALESDEYFVYADEVYAQIEINRRGDEYFNDDIESLKEWLRDSASDGAKQVIEKLKQATSIYFFRVFFGAHDTDEVMKVFLPLWDWFFANREGILHIEDVGFYDKSGFLAEAE